MRIFEPRSAATSGSMRGNSGSNLKNSFAPLQMLYAGDVARGWRGFFGFYSFFWALFLIACIHHLHLHQRSGNLKRGIIVNHDPLDGLYLFFKVTGIDSLLDFIGKCFCP
jgi:hypothetical protein